MSGGKRRKWQFWATKFEKKYEQKFSGELVPTPPSLQHLLRCNLSFRAYTFKTSRYAPLLLVLRVQNFWTVVSDSWIYRRRSRLHFDYFNRHLLADWRYGESEVSVRVIKNLNGRTPPRPSIKPSFKKPLTSFGRNFNEQLGAYLRR